MKILVVGNHCCSNRGDAAILRGLIDCIEGEYPHVKIDFTSRYPDGAKWFFKNNTVFPDILSSKKSKSLYSKVKSRLLSKYIFSMYVNGYIKEKIFLPKVYNEFSKFVTGYDLVIQVGGSFFVDFYGTSQFEASAISINNEVPIIMIGHSVGPFKLNNTKNIAKTIFSNANSLILRETESESHLNEIGLANENYIIGSDTAWAIEPERYQDNTMALSKKYSIDHRTIAITLRDLAPFDKRLGVSQEEYESKLAILCNRLIDKGYNIIALSTCTGFDSYHRDDRVPALRLESRINNRNKFSVLMEDLTDIELGFILGKCRLTIGTRLHSAILSMRFGTPAFALYYEHKSLGILNKLGLDEYSIRLNDIDSDSVTMLIESKIENIEKEKIRVYDKVHKEGEECKRIIIKSLSSTITKNKNSL